MPDTPQQQISPADFAAKIKAKYPAYANMNDNELVSKVTAKYPQYKSQINFVAGTPKTIAPSPAQSSSTIHNADVGLQQGVAKSFGLKLPNEEDPSTLSAGDMLKQMFGNLYRSGKESLKEWGPLAPVDMIAKGIEGTASSIESGGKTAIEGIKSRDMKTFSRGGGEMLGSFGQLFAGEAVPEAIKTTTEAAGSARESIGGAIHTPEGELTPTAKMVGKVGGGATGAGIGSLFGHEYIGGAAGYKLGPSLLDRIFPEPSKSVVARETFKSTKEITEAQEGAIVQAEKMARAERAATAKATREAIKLRDEALAARDRHAQDLMRRQAEQDKLDAAEARAANAAMRNKRESLSARDKTAEDLMKRQRQQDALDKEAARAASEAEKSRTRHAEDLMKRQREQDALDEKHAKALNAIEVARQKELTASEKLKTSHAEALNRRGGIPMGEPTLFGNPPEQSVAVPGLESQDLISRTKKLVRPGEEPDAGDLKRAGDMTQVQLPKLRLLASWGDKLAENEINRRLRNQ